MSSEPWPFAPSDSHGWPEPGTDTKLYEAQLEVRKKRTDEEIARAAAERAADQAVAQEFYKGIIEVAKGSIDRSRASAEFVQKAAGAIAVIYAGVLGVAFSVAERPLPTRGVIPAIFLGLSIVFATSFIAWLPNLEAEARWATKDESPPGTPLKDRLAVLFIRWNRRTAVHRRKWLRAGVVALAAAIALLPAAFIPIGDQAPTAQIDFPRPSDAAPGANLELRKILYQAKVTTAAETEKEPITGENDWVWWVLAGVGIVLVIILPQIPIERKEA